MPVTPLTTDCRVVAQTMIDWPGHLSGNLQIMRRMVYEDSVKLAELRDTIAALGEDGPEAGQPGDTASVTLATTRISNLMECSGNIQLWPLLPASAGDVTAACDFLDAQA
jgi:hypothetical protein